MQSNLLGANKATKPAYAQIPVTWEMFQLDAKLRAISVDNGAGGTVTYAGALPAVSFLSLVF